MQSRSVRTNAATHGESKRLALSLGATVSQTGALAVRRLRQERIGQKLGPSPSRAETEWLDAELG